MDYSCLAFGMPGPTELIILLVIFLGAIPGRS